MAEHRRIGLRFVEHVMGTVFSFDVRDPITPEIASAAGEAVAFLHHVDKTFSTFRPDSAVSRINRGQVTPDQCSPDVNDVLALCAKAREVSGGWFSETASKSLDPSGLVKGWAIRGASDLLHTAGARNTCINGGGDLQFRGSPSPGATWRAGIADPARPGSVVATITVNADMAVATSGSAERGLHIHDPWTGRLVHGDRSTSVTVVGPDITWADAYATAAFAMGPHAARRWMDTVEGYEMALVGPDLVESGRGLWVSPGLRVPGVSAAYVLGA